MNTKQTDTPETDSLITTIGCGAMHPYGGFPLIADHARRLERERDELHAAIRNLRDVKGRYHSQQAYERLIALLPESQPVRNSAEHSP